MCERINPFGLGRAWARWLAILTCCAPATAFAAASYNVQWFGVPDFDQKRESGFLVPNPAFIPGLCGGGKNYCGPTTAVDWFAFINNHGYPIMGPVNTNWQLDKYNDVTALIDHEAMHMTVQPTTLCDAGTSFGKVDDGLRDHLNESALTKDKFFTIQADNEGEWYVGPTDLRMWMTVGGMISLEVGWYDYDSSSDKYTMASGHFMPLVQVADDDLATSAAKIAIMDPAGSDGDNVGEYERLFQSPFKRSTYNILRKYVTIRHKFQLGYDTRFQYKVEGFKSNGKQGFINSYTALMGAALVGLPTNGNFVLVKLGTLDIDPLSPPSANGTGAPADAVATMPGRAPSNVRDIQLHPTLPAAFLRTGFSRTNPGELGFMDPVRGYTPLGKTTGDGPIAVGRRGTLYAATGLNITAIDLDNETTAISRRRSLALNLAPDAMAYDEGRRRMFALDTDLRRVADFDETLAAVRYFELDSGVRVTGSAALTFDPSTQSLWLANASALVRLRVDERAGRVYAAETVALTVTIDPRSVSFTDAGRIVAWSTSDVIELARIYGQYRDVTSAYAGRGLGPLVRMMRSHTAADPRFVDLPVPDDFPDLDPARLASCPADLTGSMPGIPDGIVDAADRAYFEAKFAEGSAMADLDNGAGFGVQDRRVDEADRLYFERAFSACR